jgi:hypothetical protein
MHGPLGKMALYLGFTLFLGYLFLEVAVRILVPSVKVKATVPGNVVQFDEMLGWSLKPLAYANSSRTGYTISYKINSKGLRDDETSYKKPAGTLRIVLIGDSRTFGFGVPIEKHFSTILEGYFKNVEVINMGVGGYGVDQELLSLRLKGFQYEPDIVLAYVAHYGGQRHMHTKRWGQEKPRFESINGELVLANSPVKHQPVTRKGRLEKMHRWMINHSRVYRIVHDARKRITNEDGAADKQKKQDELRFQDETFRRGMYQLGAEIVFAMDAESLEQGASFALITQIDELHQSALNHGILSVDVSTALSNSTFPLPDNLAHINEAGNGVLAWEIVKFLKKKKLIPAHHLNP